MKITPLLSMPLMAMLFVLLTFHSGFGQSLTRKQAAFLKSNAATICVDSSLDHPDWRALLPHLKNKKIILIGESNHGSKEIFELRNSLIQYLHKEIGIKAILLESGMGELIAADLDRANLTPTQMTYGLFGGWRTKEFVELMAYAKAQNIAIAGFDVQRTGNSFHRMLMATAQQYGMDTLQVNSLESRYGTVNRELTQKKAVYDSSHSKTTQIIRDYQSVKNSLSIPLTKDGPKDLLFTHKTLENRIQYLSYMLQFLKDKNWHNRWAARDSAMASNAQWLIDNLYKDGPVVIIAHNFHIAKSNEQETVMGKILQDHYDDLYAIGVFAGSGAYHDNSGKTVTMLPPDSTALDIKHVIARLEGAAHFIDMPTRFSKGSAWLNQEIVVNDTFIDLSNSNKMILSRAFDGLLLLKRVSPPRIE